LFGAPLSVLTEPSNFQISFSALLANGMMMIWGQEAYPKKQIPTGSAAFIAVKLITQARST
jgi:hypothetical protein